MTPTFWKLSMGPGSSSDDFPTILSVLDWVRQGLVLVHKNTKAKGTSTTTQGELFVEHAKIGDYFYLCHGNGEPSVILLGQFTSAANLFSERAEGWAERSFRWIKTALLTKSYSGEAKWWAPNHNSTFVAVPESELGQFESSILEPYFAVNFEDFGIEI